MSLAESYNSPHFELTTYKDLFVKAKHDLNKLQKCVNSYDLFNFLCTINHLYEWVKKASVISENELPSRINGGTLDCVRKLCNRAKHFKKEKGSPQTKIKKGHGMGRFGAGKFGVGEPSYTVLVNGENIPILKLCGEALEIWENFLKDNKLFELG